jgi:hypothetical protein
MKVLYNAKHGGFGFSDTFVDEFKKRHPEKDLNKWSVERSDPDTIALFEEMGSDESSGYCADLRIEEIPDDVELEIDEYDGLETVWWSLPKDIMLRDLVDVLKGRKKVEETNKFTQRLLQEDCSTTKLWEIVRDESTASCEKEGGDPTTET